MYVVYMGGYFHLNFARIHSGTSLPRTLRIITSFLRLFSSLRICLRANRSARIHMLWILFVINFTFMAYSSFRERLRTYKDKIRALISYPLFISIVYNYLMKDCLNNLIGKNIFRYNYYTCKYSMINKYGLTSQEYMNHMNKKGTLFILRDGV